ncbi:hypothetical protein LTR56_025743 [Elasticomyces elasticus]|nr:hypothetical protein LTR56_025743 [Elasticomyces elasticus]KAK3657650.1 hypothetical protein LTR22_009202 [Elasticomyces elasticus]KAK4922456.1 hypothetical protein LTR49_010156 [Elasticomyces elasticus]KAK5760543.1 hypothetical protein LTS12_009252 [Elasticomyces elasticus]
MATTTQTTQLPPKMRAVQIVEFNKPHEIRDIPTPRPEDLTPHDLLLKIAVPGLCHSDLEYMKGFFPIKLPVTGSHEGTGTVVAKGSGVKNFEIGDRVLAGMTFGRCGECDVCKGPENYQHYCPNRETMMSVERNGAFQEYLVVDGREAARLPDKMSFATAAPLACAGATSWRAVLQCHLQPGEWIGIVGSGGGLGHLASLSAIQMAKKAKGLKVVAVDARDQGLALSRESGADVVLDARKGTAALIEEVKKATGGGGVHAAITVSDHPTAAETACAITRHHGRMIQVAVVEKVSIPLMELLFKDIRVSGSFMASQGELDEMLHAVVEHDIKVENNIFKGLNDVPKAVEMLRNGEYRGKACFIVDEQAVGLVPGNGYV